MFHLLPPLIFYIILFSFTTATKYQPWKYGNFVKKHIYSSDDIDDLNFLKKTRKTKRRKKHRYNRLDLNEHFEMCRVTNGFQNRYHMSEQAYKKLVRILNIQVDEGKSKASTNGNEPISSEMIVAIGLRFLGGEKPKSLADIFGTSTSSINRVIDEFLNAVDISTHRDLSTDLLPKTEEDRMRIAEEWNERSDSLCSFFGCLSAIDGWLCTTECPSDIPNPPDYCSGH